METEEIIKNLSKALIGWYDFRADSRILFVSGGRPECETIFGMLEEKGLNPAKADAAGLGAVSGKFDYIVAAGIIERSDSPVELLDRLRELLRDSGKLLVGAENRLGIRYFCGDKDPFSGHVFDGPDGYVHVSVERRKANGGRAYAKAEYERMLSDAGFPKRRFYAVMPDLARPQMLIAEDYVPNEAVDVRICPQYGSPETVFLEEERLYGTLLENGIFHPMANAFLIECTVDGELSDAGQITVQGDRARDGALATVIKYPEHVIKKALYPEGRKRIRALSENAEYLRRHAVPAADGRTEGDAYVMPWIEGRIATEYFRELLREDTAAFMRELEAFRNIIMNSSEHVPYEEVNWREFEPRWEERKRDDPNIDRWRERAFGTDEERENIGIILKRGYIDMVSLNCFHTKEGFVFFDQEFYYENFPLNTILIRTIDLIYGNSPDLEGICPVEEVLKHFGLYEYRQTWREKGIKFTEKLRSERALAGYHRRHRRDYRTTASNRRRMDYPREEYERLFTNIFKGTGNKKTYLFGSGRYAEQFIEQFGQYCDIAGIVDNNKERWGESLSGVAIHSPDILKEPDAPFKVFICIKFFEDVLEQLKDMGIKDISVYDPRLDYERPVQIVSKEEKGAPKKYHIGYVAGVFDLFHIGHLNLLKRAKEQCDYLIAGVVSDEQVINGKKTRPYIPFEERFEIVRSCRYVDEAVAIPVDRAGTADAWYMYHFDAQFSGSDYADDPVWLANKVFLQQHGADMVFFPYTETTSSTAIKEQICNNEALNTKQE
ncbi:MAG: adenylyltransferase/cytidyltransferase family protein [Lachnospiraceae bacterium]|nr:adenylyltransferase/cytidyltransferase family protein [Lachnospiraceae bacterium]